MAHNTYCGPLRMYPFKHSHAPFTTQCSYSTPLAIGCAAVVRSPAVFSKEPRCTTLHSLLTLPFRRFFFSANDALRGPGCKRNTHESTANRQLTSALQLCTTLVSQIVKSARSPSLSGTQYLLRSTSDASLPAYRCTIHHTQWSYSTPLAIGCAAVVRSPAVFSPEPRCTTLHSLLTLPFRSLFFSGQRQIAEGRCVSPGAAHSLGPRTTWCLSLGMRTAALGTCCCCSARSSMRGAHREQRRRRTQRLRYTRCS